MGIFMEENIGINAAIVALTAAIMIVGWRFISSSMAPACPIDKTEYRKFPLIKKDKINYNTALYRFALPNKNQSLGLPIGQHVSLKAKIDGKDIVRSYTPTSLDSDRGHFDLVIKSYPSGMLSKYVDSMKIGDEIEVRGPKGKFLYTANMCRHIGMIAGGTGITPMLQVARAILQNPNDKTKVSLVFANVNEEDILLKDILDELDKKHENFSVYYVLNNPPNGWKGGKGFVTADMIKKHCPAPAKDIKILICGPPPMVKAMQSNCESLGYDKPNALSKLEDMVFKF